GVLCAASARAQRVYVDDDAPPGGDGSSWALAYRDLELALVRAASGASEIWVAEGRYVPSSAGASFVVPKNVLVYGGFAGNETGLSQRDPALHRTLLDGDINGDDQPDWVNYADNCEHVVLDTGAGRSHMDGFTVRGGRLGPGAGLFFQAPQATLE